MARDIERPSALGALTGESCVALFDAGMAAKDDGTLQERCNTCAFRPGTLTNQLPNTMLVAWKCAIGADADPFGCHHGMVDGKPTDLCVGWFMAQQAPFERVKEICADLAAKVNALPPDAEDEIRKAFDAWLVTVDPNDELTNYERGRLYNKAKKREGLFA